MKPKAGLFSIGLETYWLQFENLLENLNSFRQQISEIIRLSGLEVIDGGMVDNPEKARLASEYLKSRNVDILFLHVSTYALSSTVLPVVQSLKVPVIILNLQPAASLDYRSFNSLGDRGKMTGIWLEHCQACSVPEIAGVFNKGGIKYAFVTGFIGEKSANDEIGKWCTAVKAVVAMRNNRAGIMGHYYGGMLDVYTDVRMQSIVFGTHFEMVEMCELKRYRDEVTQTETEAKLREFDKVFDVTKECEPSELERAARTSVALDRLIRERNLGALAYYYEGQPGNDYEDIITSIIAGNTLLTGRNIPVAGECEIKNVQAMKIMSEIGAGGSFSEFYLMDFKDDVILMGHDGPAHFSIAEGKVKLVPLPVFHGKPGKGLSIQMTVKHGPVSLLSVVEGNNGVFLLTAEGESVPGDVMNIGNTNSRYRFPIGARNFIEKWSEQGPAHHCAIGTGHVADEITKFGKLLDIPVVRIC